MIYNCPISWAMPIQLAFKEGCRPGVSLMARMPWCMWTGNHRDVSSTLRLGYNGNIMEYNGVIMAIIKGFKHNFPREFQILGQMLHDISHFWTKVRPMCFWRNNFFSIIIAHVCCLSWLVLTLWLMANITTLKMSWSKGFRVVFERMGEKHHYPLWPRCSDWELKLELSGLRTLTRSGWTSESDVDDVAHQCSMCSTSRVQIGCKSVSKQHRGW